MTKTISSLVVAGALASAGCGGSLSKGERAADAVRGSGTDVTSCVTAWSGYGGMYDDPQYADLAVIRSRWRCTLVTPRDWHGVSDLTDQREWCFSWTEGSDAEDLGYPADLEVSGEKSC